jgi:hypothetical protein
MRGEGNEMGRGIRRTDERNGKEINLWKGMKERKKEGAK